MPGGGLNRSATDFASKSGGRLASFHRLTGLKELELPDILGHFRGGSSHSNCTGVDRVILLVICHLSGNGKLELGEIQ